MSAQRRIVQMRATKPVGVLGAGIAGLTAAHDLVKRGYPVKVFEASPAIAGMAQSFTDGKGVKYDFGAHLITNRLAAALGVSDRCYTISHYDETVYLDGKTYDFPFGLLTSPKLLASAMLGKVSRSRSKENGSAADWYRACYGRQVADRIAIPLLEAWSGVTADELAPSVIPPHVDRGTLNVVALKLASKLSGRAVANGFSREKAESANVWHVYPKGGVVELCKRLAEGLDDQIVLNTRVSKIVVKDEVVQGVVVGDEHIDCSAVISTAPVHILPKLVSGTARLDHLSKFRYRPLVLATLVFNKRPVLPAVTTWIPESRHPFFRLTEVSQSVPWLAPDGMTAINVDIGCSADSDIYGMESEEIGELCVAHLEELFPGVRRHFEACNVIRTPIGYPVYLLEYERQRRELECGVPVGGLYCAGRNAEFAHILMEDIYWRTLEKMRYLREWVDGTYRMNGS